MPSSLIFAGLVVLWLLILVPAVARHQQEVARPSVAALSGRVLERPRRAYRMEEVDDVHDIDDDVARDGSRATTARIPAARATRDTRDDLDGSYGDADHGDADHGDADYEDVGYEEDAGYEDAGYEEYVDDDRWERPAPRYRPGRGGFDPEAAALTARARYAFRQRVVLGLLVAAAATALLALLVQPALWWAHGAVDVALVGYLGYLRQQVRMEETIRNRRASRMAGTRRPPAADDPELDEWARRGRDVARPEPEPEPAPEPVDEYPVDDYEDDDLVDDTVERVSGTGEPIGPIASTAMLVDEPALPRLTPAPPPPLPAGTSVVDADLDDPGLHDLEAPARPDYRRAAGE
ncbi:gephyrin-like molybdotransferase receptor GlpR [Pseudonocardia sp.]|uniref:divisome protein SepX/GlpR n=1 Tax=Pseudonocardia sp. TaxID=60912 RepID=UPI002606F166|nr:gephyrin-like molybdotransferase receptor GlpR [Pseudonocardia sp.]